MRKDAVLTACPTFVHDGERPNNKGHSFRLSNVPLLSCQARPKAQKADQTHKTGVAEGITATQQPRAAAAVCLPASESLKNQSKAKGCC